MRADKSYKAIEKTKNTEEEEALSILYGPPKNSEANRWTDKIKKARNERELFSKRKSHSLVVRTKPRKKMFQVIKQMGLE